MKQWAWIPLLVFSMPAAAESIAIDTKLDPPESVLIETVDGSSGEEYFATYLREQTVLGRKLLSKNKYEKWKTALKRSLPFRNEGSCLQRYTWTLHENQKTTQYSFCPSNTSPGQIKELNRITTEIQNELIQDEK